MAHHSLDPRSSSRLRAMFEREGTPLGPTKQFPQGKLTDDDEGELRIAVGQQDGKVVIDFGSPVAWVGFTPEQAEEIGNLIRQHGIEARLRR